ncbi:MAG TPA: right-handed parallel beta-helix repeat-containing protein, partial [Dokdonella sp.]|uniref:right-handed parallel beta-helix repeat-containing protein n=1 Tax=Dokdonella sp. TaxID=2291710 RepID=UPI002C33A63B
MFSHRQEIALAVATRPPGLNKRGRRKYLRALVAVVLLAFSTASMALEFCVGTITELNTALTIATSPTGQTTVIKIKQGTYHVGSGLLTGSGPYTIFRPLELQGGYNSDCSARTINPDNTIFDADAADHLAISVLGTSLIEGIRFQNISGYHSVNIGSAADDVSIRVRNNAFVGVNVDFKNRQDPDGESTSGLFARFINNRINGFPGSVGTPIALDIAGASHVRVVGNTIADNIGIGMRLCANDDIIVSNNIAWNNTSGDIRIFDDCSGDDEPGDVQLKSNMFGNVIANPVGDSSNNFPGTNPVFANPGSGNYRLQNSSPAINAGTISGNQASVDLAGNPRVIGSTVDIGGYESSIDDTVATTQVVTNSNDSGAGSLRQAILNANANPDFSFINFDIPGNCPRTISPSSDLPAITQGVRIDAYTQPGSTANTRSLGDNATRCILLNGADLRATGLRYSGPSTSQFWLQGLAIGGFTTGLSITGGTDALVWGNQFGGAFSTFNLLPNGTNIVLTALSSSASIGGTNPAQRNVIAAATDAGISIGAVSFFASTGNEIVGNLIGADGPSEAGVVGNGVGIRISTRDNTVRDNVIVHSTSDGVLLEGAGANGNTIEDNRIGKLDLFCTGFPVIVCNDTVAPNARHGISMTAGAHDNALSTNAIWNNGSMGISIAGNGKDNNLAANSVFRNDAYGIDLDGVGFNDNDADPAAQNLPNRGLNYPGITRVYGGSAYGWIEGTFNSTNGVYGIQVFSSPEADNQANGEGEASHRLPGFLGNLIGIDNAPGGQNGSTSFRFGPFSNSGPSLANRWFALTATDTDG